MKKIFLFFAILIFCFTFCFSEGMNHYFGNMHSHTSYSDGTADPETAYEHAKNKSTLDILTVTDHARAISFTSDGESEWMKTEEMAKKFSDDKFLGTRGFEWTITGPGHITVYDTEYFASSAEVSFDGIYKWIILNGGIGNFCHPKTYWGTFDDFRYYPMADGYMTMFEIINTSAEIQPVYFDNYIKALNKGWHIAPTANQDNHKPNWGSANRSRTVFIMDELTEENLYKAMRNRNLYASEDENAKVDFYTDYGMMGSILYDLPEIEMNLEYEDMGEKIDRIYLYSSHGVEELDAKGDAFKISFTRKIDERYEWFFIRLVQRDNDDIVTAPIWVQSGEKTYLKYAELDNPNPVKGSEYAVNFSMVNMNFKNKKFVLDIVNKNGETLYSEDVYVEPVSNYERYITLSDESGELSFMLNGVCELKLPVKFKESSVKIDISHENNFNKLNNMVKKYVEQQNGVFEKLRSLGTESIGENCVLVMPFPDSESFMPKYGILSEEQLEILNKLIEENKIKLLLIFDTKKGTLSEAAQSFNSLLKMNETGTTLSEDGKSLIFDESPKNYRVRILETEDYGDERIIEEIIRLLGE